MMRLLLCFLLMSSSAVFGGIQWRQKEIRLQVHPTQIMTEAVFRFSNTGDKPASLSDVVITCGCMNAKPTKSSYAPGEEGELVIMIDLRNREGELRKMVQVRTSDGEESVLAVVVDIPRAYVVSTPLVRWGKGDAATEKTVHLTNPNTMPIALQSITSSNEAMPAELKTIREGFEYKVVIHRKTTDPNVRSVIRISAEPPPGEKESKTIKLYAVAP